jgi:hypothetical protein
MKQRQEKELLCISANTQVPNNFSSQGYRLALEKRQLDFRRSQQQIKSSMIKRNSSLMAVRKSLEVVDEFYQLIHGDSVMPPNKKF